MYLLFALKSPGGHDEISKKLMQRLWTDDESKWTNDSGDSQV